MLEFFAYKKFKKHKDEKKAEEEGQEGAKEAGSSKPDAAVAEGSNTKVKPSLGKETEHVVLEESDQAFIERILAQSNSETPPPLPPRVTTPDISWESGSESGDPVAGPDASKGKEKDDKKKHHRFSFLPNPMHHLKSSKASSSKAEATPGKDKNLLEPVAPITETEAERESADLSSVLSKLNFAAGTGNKAISLSPDTAELVSKFTNVFKDLMNGVPTAYDDLMSLIDDHDGVLSRNYEKLPSSLKKLITTLPTKLTSTLAPELLAVAAEAQGLERAAAEAGKEVGKEELKEAAKGFLTPSNVKKMVTKPGALVGMLKGIVNALKTRWPAFMGTNVVWAVAISILMFVLWYCHKRGREVRLEKEKLEGVAEVKDGDRIEELPDDPALSAPPGAAKPAGPSVTVTEPPKL